MDVNVPTIVIEPMVLFREGLRRILYEANFQVFWCNDHVPADPIPALPPDAAPLVILGANIDEAIVQIGEVKRHYPNARIVLLMEPGARDQVMAALRCGADTLVLKRTSYEAFIGTLKLVLEGATVLPSQMIEILLADPEEPAQAASTLPMNGFNGKVATSRELLRNIVPHNAPQIEDASHDEPAQAEPVPQGYGLSLRELGVLERLREGRSNKEIARDLGITEATVKVHVKAILRKARMRNRTQVAMWASRLGVGVSVGVGQLDVTTSH